MEGIIEGDPFNQVTDVFLSWLQSTGATVSQQIRVADLRDRQAGRGVVAQSDIADETELFSIPRAAILTAQNSSIPPDCLETLEDPWLQLILAMIFEHQNGSESRWAPYLNILPTSFNTLMFWSDQELSQLKGSAVVNKISKNKANETFAQQVIPVVRNHSSLFHAEGLDDNALLALCHRMGSTIMAYAFDLESPSSDPPPQSEEEWEEDEDEGQGKGMVPMADLLNADADRNNAKLFYEEDQVVMKAIKPILAGEEIFNDYGALPSADVLRRYGYVTENYQQYDCVEVSADLIKTQAISHAKLSSSEFSIRWEFLTEQGLTEDGFDILRAGSEESQFSEELIVILNILTLSKEDFGNHKRKDKLPKPELTTKSQQLLRAILVHRLADYPRDAGLTDTSDGSVSAARSTMAMQVVKGEKLVLHEALAALPAPPQSGKKRSADTLEDEVEQIRKKTKK